MSLCTSRIKHFAACCLLLTATASSAAVPDAFEPPTMYVGASSNCQYHTLADVIAATPSAGWQIRVEGNLAGQHATIQNKNLAILPGLCPNSTGTVPTQVTISGAGGANAPVLTITGTSNVHLTGLIISAGHSGSIDGGGISYNGSSILTLTNVTVSGNTADYGGGINFKGNGGAAELHLDHDVLITANTANFSGGGIRIEGGARLFMLGDNSSVAFNHANGSSGGGIEILSNAKADIGSPGYFGIAAVYANDALYGGGIAMFQGHLRLFTTDPTRPIRIEGNSAANTGGGIYLANLGSSLMCASDFGINGNLAQEGSAIYGGFVYLNPKNGCDGESEPISTYGAVACVPGTDCNSIHGNEAVNTNNSPTNGAAVFESAGGVLAGDQFHVRANTGGYALHIVDDSNGYTIADLSNCLFADNTVTMELIHAGGGDGHLGIANCTLAHDQIGGSHVIYAENSFSLDDSIIDEPGIPALAFSGPYLGGLYNLANDPSGLAGGPTVLAGEPTFVDAANGDYRLSVVRQAGTVFASLGVDYAPAVTGDDRDLRTLPHDQDLGGVSDRFGVRDLGAYEMQFYPDRIFVDSLGDPVRVAY